MHELVHAYCSQGCLNPTSFCSLAARCSDCHGMQIDWDYHMRLAQQGTPGLDPSAGSIVHFYHFRRWRESGTAYELRDCRYNEVNRTLLSTAYGSRKEYKDRSVTDLSHDSLPYSLL